MKDVLTTIPKTMVRFFGRTGSMVKPSEETVANLIAQIPQGKLITIDEVRRKIAMDFSVDATCPATTVKALRLIGSDGERADSWRVVKKRGELIPQLPGGVEGQAARLAEEGFDVDYSGAKPRVINHESLLFEFP